MMASRYTATWAGDALLVDFHDDLIYVSLDRWREQRGDAWCEVRFRCRAPGYPENLHQSRWNVASMSQRDALVRVLRKRYDKADWADLIETLARVALEERRQGVPVVLLNEVAVEDTSPRWRLDGWVTESGVTLIYGDGGSAKSTVAMALACCIEAGLPFLGLKTRRGHVLYVDYETDEGQQARRLALIAAGLGIPAPAIDYTKAVVPLAEWAPDLKAKVIARKVSCVVIDSLGYAGAALVEAEPVIAVYRALHSLGVPVVALHHVAKHADGATPYGSVYNRNSARSVIEMRRQSDEGGDVLYAAWYHTKLNDGRPQRPMGMKIEFGSTKTSIQRADIRDAPDLVARLPMADRALDVLRDGPLSAKDLGDLLECSPGTLRQTLRRLKSKNKVVRLQNGSWALADLRHER